MKKFVILTIIALLFIELPVFARERRFTRGIIFNNVPFTPETAGNFTRNFNRGERIYWLYMSKKPIKAQFIEVQVVSTIHKIGWITTSGITYTHDYRINRDNPHYFTDYFVIHSPGHYYMQVFDKNNLLKPLTYADFYVR